MINLNKDVFRINEINIKFTNSKDIYCELIPAEFKHVLLNLFANSKDAFLENRSENKTIDISLVQKSHI